MHKARNTAKILIKWVGNSLKMNFVYLFIYYRYLFIKLVCLILQFSLSMSQFQPSLGESLLPFFPCSQSPTPFDACYEG